jgi:hypothetical protein
VYPQFRQRLISRSIGNGADRGCECGATGRRGAGWTAAFVERGEARRGSQEAPASSGFAQVRFAIPLPSSNVLAPIRVVAGTMELFLLDPPEGFRHHSIRRKSDME